MTGLYCTLWLLCFLVQTFLSRSVEISNDFMALDFSEATGALTSFRAKEGTEFTELLDVEDTSGLSVWELQLVDSLGAITIESANREMEAFEDENGLLSMTWNSISIFRKEDDDPLATISVTLSVSLSGPLSTWNLGFHLMYSNSEIGLWQASILVPTTAGSDEINGELFFPTGYGHAYINPINSTEGSISGVYPSGGASMQFLAAVNDQSYSNSDALPTSGAYVGALDMKGFMKTIEYVTWDERVQRNSDNVSHATYQKLTRRHRDRSGLFVASRAKNTADMNFDMESRGSDSRRVSFLSISSVVDNAGKPISAGFSWDLPYAVAVGVVNDVSHSNGFPLWYQAAKMYREYIHPSAPWLQQKISDRVPAWYR